MSTRETSLNQDNPSLRGAIPEPTDLISYVPGAPIPFDVPHPPVSLADITPHVDELYSHAGELVGKVINEYAKPLDELHNGMTEIHAKVVGGISNDIDPMEQHAAKIASKVQSNISNGMREIYSGMNDIGLPTPTLEQVRYGNASGDYIGSMLGQDDGPREKKPTVDHHTDTDGKGGNQYSSSHGIIQDDSGLIPNHSNVVAYGDGSKGGPAGLGNDTPTTPPYQTTHSNPPPPPGPPTQPPCNPTGGRHDLYLPGSPVIVDGWSRDINDETQGGDCGVIFYTPILDMGDVSRATNWPGDEICIDESYFFNLPQTDPHAFGQIGFLVPKGTFLIYNERTGKLWAAENCPTGYRVPFGQKYCPQGQAGTGGPSIPSEPPPPNQPKPPLPPLPPEDPYVPGEHCPALPNLSCGPKGKTGFPPFPASTNACDTLDATVSKVRNADVTFADWVKMATGDAPDKSFNSGIMKGLFGSDKDVLPGLIGRFAAWLQTINKDAVSKLDCDPSVLIPITTFQGLIELVEKWTGVIPDQLMIKTDQISNTACQSKLPSGSAADAAYLANTINQPEWECWQKAEGNHLDPATRVRDASRTKLSPDQYVALYKRGYITEEIFRKALRECGVITEGDVFDLLNYADQWPQIADIIRLMTRDVADPEVVKLSELDTDFDKKWTGRVEQYGNAAGVTKEIALDYWRAHWDIPSFTQLTEMYHRLRPGLVAPEDAVDRDMVLAALKQNDMAPGWVNRMLMIAEHVIPAGDAVKAYYLHTVEETFLYNNYRDHGSNDDAANTMVDYHKTERTRRDKAAAGFPTVKALAKSYARCEITLRQFTDTVDEIAVNDDQKRYAQDAARLTRIIEDRKSTIRSVMRPYMRGLIDDGQASQMLAEAGIESDCVPGLIRGWQKKQQKQSKHMNASQLCDMRNRGIITAEEQSTALVRSGWDSVDAWRIVGSCEAKLSEKEEKAAAKAIKDAKTAADKAAKAAKKAAREAECGPPPCPKSRQKSTPASGGGQ